jgi:hypothetical protein
LAGKEGKNIGESVAGNRETAEAGN